MNQKLSVKPVSKRLLAPLILGLMLLIGGVILLVSYLHHQHLQEISLLTENEVLSDLQFLYEENTRSLKALSDTLVQRPAVKSALKAKDPVRLLADFQGLAESYQQEHGLSHFYFHSADRDILLRVYKPDSVGGRADRFVVRKAEKTGQTAAGLEVGSMGTLTLRVVRPVFEEENALVGFVELGTELSWMLERLPVSRKTHLSMILQKSFLQRERWEAGMRWVNRSPNWNQFPDEVLVYSTLAVFPQELVPLVNKENQKNNHSSSSLRLDDRDWRVMVIPLVDAGGNLVGDLLVMYDITSLNTAYRRVLATIVGGSGLLLLGFCYLVIGLLQRADRGILQQQQALAESEDKYRILFDNSSVSILIHDNQAEVVDANQCALRSYGVTSIEELKGLDIYSEHSRQEFDELLTKLEEEGSQRFEWRSRNVKGETFWEDVNTSKMMVAGHMRFVSSAIDITERKVAEAALKRKNEEMEQFVYSVSHDLKSPLVTVKTFTGMLRQDLLNADQPQINEDLNYIDKAADKMQQLLDSLLQYSRIGKSDTPAQTLSAGQSVADCLTALAGILKQHEVQVSASELPHLLHGDPLHFGQIWQNLIENAVKYRGNQAQPRIEIGATQEGHEVVFYVRDNGMGIAPEHRERIFNLFSQLNPESDGSGLGLALVKKIVSIYQGRIWVESAGRGEGSCFYFTLPDTLIKEDAGL